MKDDHDSWVRRAAEMRKAAHILLERAEAVEAMILPPSSMMPSLMPEDGGLPAHHFGRRSVHRLGRRPARR